MVPSVSTMTTTTKELGTGNITVQAYPGVIWRYENAEEVRGGIEYMKQDLAYLERMLAAYREKKNDFMIGKMETNVANGKRLLELLNATLASL
jgi:hypothetical protein